MASKKTKNRANNVFLVTRDGERHEDHIPIGFYDYQHLQLKFPFYELAHEEISLEDGKWHFLEVLNISDHYFPEEKKEAFRAGKWYPYDSDDNYYTIVIRVILVQKNKEVGRT